MKTLELYFEAARNIRRGIPVINLERIRQDCNEEYKKKHNHFKKEIVENYTGLMILTYVVARENKILMGENPNKLYKNVSRERALSCLDKILQNLS